jgi:glycosyltransferase involved in cell wall biosynthesis
MQTSSKKQPIVSIGMPVFNCAGTVAQAICSILNQTSEDWELLIIDDGSKDNTLEIAASFGDPRIIVTTGENKGLSTRLNECVSRARGTYFARMDGDDIAYPGRLQCQLEFLGNHPEVDLVGGWVVVFRNEGEVYGTRRSPLTHGEICAHSWSGIPIAHPTWMGRAEWFRRYPYRSDCLRMEDQDLLFSTYPKSRFANVQQVILGYREDSLSLTKILLARKNMCKMMVRMAREQRRFKSAALGIVSLAAKGLVDTIAIGTGLNYYILQHRAPAIRCEEETEWRTVWESVRLAADEFMTDRKSVSHLPESTAI